LPGFEEGGLGDIFGIGCVAGEQIGGAKGKRFIAEYECFVRRNLPALRKGDQFRIGLRVQLPPSHAAVLLDVHRRATNGSINQDRRIVTFFTICTICDYGELRWGRGKG